MNKKKILLGAVVAFAAVSAGIILWLMYGDSGKQAEVAPPAPNVPVMKGPTAPPPATAGEVSCDDGKGAVMSRDEARSLAAVSTCTQLGKLEGSDMCNNYTGTWWLGLVMNNPEKGCNPACVVNVATKEVEVNWRCTGLVPEGEARSLELEAGSQ